MKTGIVKNSVSLIGALSLVVGAFVLFQLLSFVQAKSVANLDEISQIKRDILIVRTLSSEGPKDVREVDLLQKLTGYCNDVGIKPMDCSIKSQTPVSNQEYQTQRYSMMIQNVLMHTAVEFFQKLEDLPENVRVVQSALARIENRSARREEERAPFLVLRMEMNEIRFRQ